eukprot:6213982-Pleurochrysis_carterae.AAC.1
MGDGFSAVLTGVGVCSGASPAAWRAAKARSHRQRTGGQVAGRSWRGGRGGSAAVDEDCRSPTNDTCDLTTRKFILHSDDCYLEAGFVIMIS